MHKKQQSAHWSLAVYIVSMIIMAAALVFCFLMMENINRKMNESAKSNLLNTTRVLENTMGNYITKDLESLDIVGELYKNGEKLDQDKVDSLCSVMGFDWIGVVDAEGNGVGCFQNQLKASNILPGDEWKPEETGYSDAYVGVSGRLQTTLWVPVYQDNEFVGTVFGNVILTKYYTANVFTFYEGDGRTYLFDGADGRWILKSFGSDGSTELLDDIYSMLLSSGNQSKDVEAFRDAVEGRQTGTAVFDFNGEPSYVCFMPLSASHDWYVATVIARDVLLKEAGEVQGMIRMIFIIFCITLVFLTITFAVWQIRRAKVREAHYREILLANISSNIDAAILIYEKNSRKTVFVSDNVYRVLGLDKNWLKEDAGHMFDWCKIKEDDRYRTDFLEGTLEKATICEVCVENELGKESRYIRLELIPADLDQEIAVLTDITKDKDIQSTLLEAMQRAEEASRAKDNFLSSMSHDIRTPMNGIIGMTAIAAAHPGDAKHVSSCLEKINEASVHLLNIINEILDMSQIESGRIKLSDEPFNLAELLQEVLSMNYPGIKQKRHTVKVHIHSMEHEQVIGDTMRLQRIVTNLISNAIKYTPEEGRITLSLKEKEAVIQGYGCYEIMVQDNGIGMSEEFQKKLFQPFEREEDVRLSRIQGTGLGMAIVKNMVNLMMGNIRVKSRKQEGTTFYVTINLKLDEQIGGHSEQLDGLPVLVVDDDLIICETVAGMLQDIGMIGEWAENGPEAIEKTVERHRKRQDYMAVLLDWKMPGMDGVETARKIRAEVADQVPIIILTAYDWSEIEEQAKDAGVDAFLSKPIYKTKLRQKLLELSSGEMRTAETAETDSRVEIPLGRRVLLAEDNELNQEIAVELLGMMGIEVDCAEDGAAAVKRFADSNPGTYDMILMDIQMPNLNGYEASRAIRELEREDGKTIPIVAMTADAFTKDVQAAHEAGMNAHLSKPISVERLKQVLMRFLQDGRVKEERKGAKDEAED